VGFHGAMDSLGRFHAKACACFLNASGRVICIIAHRTFHIPEFRNLPKKPQLIIKLL
jgi:hypothetical protein